MQTTAQDREDLQADLTQQNQPSDDARLDIFDLWRDLGGSD